MACRLIIVCVAAVLCASCGPRMRNQISVQPYKQPMPAMPAGTVPTTGRNVTNTLAQSTVAVSPIRPTPAVLRDGRIYYGYYCAMCHGAKGDGNGPVGESYVPKPTDLTSPAIAGLSDGALYYGMLHGIGHDSVLVQTVIPEHRWPLVAYVRTLGGAR